VVPRVLTVQNGPDLEDAEAVIAADGDAALSLLRRERFDAVIVDLGLAPIDSWCVLATVGNWVERPRLVAIVTDPDHVGRAIVLGADLCVMAGTQLHARALCRATTELPKEMECPPPHTTSFPRATRAGASA
jgi:DNA-binding NarL/FixJ family response regulator